MPPANVVIAVLTYRRPSGLHHVLSALREHVASADCSGTIMVIDNDDEPTAADVVAMFPGVRYVHEPRPGIVAARNRALDEADGERLLVFIDDDERPEPGWLDALVATWARSGAAAVVGPVVPDFEIPPVDPWIEAGGYFERPRFPTGTERPAAGTGNMLLDLDVVRSLALRFDDRFAASGGSDTFFTQTLVRLGGRIVWCDEAGVVDVVPAERMTRTWVLRRARRMGNSRSRASVLGARPGIERGLARVRLVCQGAVRLGGGGTRYLLGVVSSSSRHQALGARSLARGFGMITGAAGAVVVGYTRGDGPSAYSPTGPPRVGRAG